MNPFYIVFSGHICAGKDTLIEELRKRGKLEDLDTVHYLTEAVNHDKDVLDAFYENMKDRGIFFDIATLGLRLTLGHSINDRRGIILGNRNVVEARETFVMHNFDNGLLSQPDLDLYDKIFKRGIEGKAVTSPDLVFFLDVPDVDILIERQKQRADSGEGKLNPEYLRELAPYFTGYKDKFKEAHEKWTLKVPRLEVLDASQESSLLADKCEQVINEMFRNRNG